MSSVYCRIADDDLTFILEYLSAQVQKKNLQTIDLDIGLHNHCTHSFIISEILSLHSLFTGFLLDFKTINYQFTNAKFSINNTLNLSLDYLIDLLNTNKFNFYQQYRYLYFVVVVFRYIFFFSFANKKNRMLHKHHVFHKIPLKMFLFFMMRKTDILHHFYFVRNSSFRFFYTKI